MSSLTLFAGSVPQNYDKYLGPYLFEPYAKDLVSRLKNENCKNVLELACGTGRLTNHVLEVLAADARLVATDLNPDMLQLAQTLVKDERIEWKVVDAHELPFEDGTFDYVLCQFGVMFFADKRKALSEICRVLQSGGKFLFNTWGSLEDNPRSAVVKDVMEDMFKNEASEFLEKGPYSFYDLPVIKQLMEGAGFTDVTIDEVRKTAIDWSIDDYLKGFLEGSPLSAFLGKYEDKRETVKQELKLALLKKFGANVETSMLAYVCKGTKK